MKVRAGLAGIVVALAVAGCEEPRIVPVMPPGVETPKPVSPVGSGAEALGEAKGQAAPPTVSTLISEPTPVGQEKKTASGLVYITEKEGTGPQAKPGQTVKVNYVGRLKDGTKFDASADHGGPAEFPVGIGRLIKGWDEGIPGMKVGEKRRLSVPGHMGYGAEGRKGVIPPNADLYFEVELLDAR